MAKDWFTEWFERTDKAQAKAVENHRINLRCQKCKNHSSCHSYIANCGAFRPR